MLEKFFAAVLLALVFLAAWKARGWNTLDEEWPVGDCESQCWRIQAEALEHWSEKVREEVFNGN